MKDVHERTTIRVGRNVGRNVGRTGQIPQIFIILMAILVIGTTLYFGTEMIISVGKTACDTGLNDQFPQQLRQVLDDNSPLGSRDQIALDAPCDMVELCFVDSRSIGNAAFSGSDATITAAVRAGTRTNVFLEDRDKVAMSFYDERIITADEAASPPSNDLCVSAKGGKFSFSVQGFGRHVKVGQIQ